MRVTFQAPLTLRRLSVKPTGIAGFTCLTVWHLLVRDTETSDSCPTALPVAVKVNWHITAPRGHKRKHPLTVFSSATVARNHVRHASDLRTLPVKLWLPRMRNARVCCICNVLNQPMVPNCSPLLSQRAKGQMRRTNLALLASLASLAQSEATFSAMFANQVNQFS